MKRFARTISTGVSVVGALLLAAPSASSSPQVVSSWESVAPTTGEAGSTGIAKFGSCMSGKRVADVVLLLDESGSLKTSDPQNARVTAAQYLVRQWSALSAESGVKIAIQTMGFSEDVLDSSGKWLDAGKDYPQLKEDLQAFAPRINGQQTDYWMALDGARKALAERAQKGGSPCQAIIWFSDGKLDAFPKYQKLVDGKMENVTKPYLDGKGVDNAAASAAASKDVCRRGGLADQVRSSGIATFAIGLAAGTARPADFDLMKSIALGENGCGAVSASGTGDFHLAKDIDELILAFDAVRTPGQLPLVQRLGVCQGKLCPAHSHRFVLDASITRVHVAASASVAGLKLVVVPPKGNAVEVPTSGEKDSRVGAAKVHSEALSARTVSLDLRSGADWTGVWSIVFVDPRKASGKAKSVTSLELSSDIEPAVTLPNKIFVGEKSAPIALGLRHRDGTPIDPRSLLGKVRVDATFTDSAGTQFPVASGLDAAGLTKPISLDLTRAADGRGALTVTAALTTAPVKPAKGAVIAGTKLSPESSDFDVDALPPVGFPTVADKVNFGTATGAAKVERALRATGPGCVWIDTSRISAAPEKAGSVGVSSSATSAQTCIKLAEGESKDIPLTFKTAAAANGSVNGTLTAHLAPTDEPGRARTKSVAFTANLDKPANTTMKWLTFALCLLAGVGIPVGLMYLVKSRTSKIPPLPLVGGVFAVSAQGGQVLRDGMPFALQPQDLRDPIPIPAAGATSLTVGPAQLRVRNGWSPLGPGLVLASIAGSAGISAMRTTPRKDAAAELPLAVHNNWALFPTPERGSGHGNLLLLVSADAPPARRQDVVDKAVQAVAQRLQALPGTAPNEPSGLAADPGSGSAPVPSLTDPEATWIPSADARSWEGSTATPSAPAGSWQPSGTGDAPPGTANPWETSSHGSSEGSSPWSATSPQSTGPDTDGAWGMPSEAPSNEPDLGSTQPRAKSIEGLSAPNKPAFDFSNLTLDDPGQSS